MRDLLTYEDLRDAREEESHPSSGRENVVQEADSRTAPRNP